jgi:hypothetical protein
MKSIILDFETLNTSPSAIVTAVSVLAYEPCEILSFDEMISRCLTLKFEWQSQIQDGRIWDQDTVDFWNLPKNETAKAMWVTPAPHDVFIREMFTGIEAYMLANGVDFGDYNTDAKVYSRGNAFEFPLMDNLYKQYGYANPFPYWSIRDVRTEIDAVMGHIDPKHMGKGFVEGWVEPEGYCKHDPRHDIVGDVMMMQLAHCQLSMALGN